MSSRQMALDVMVRLKDRFSGPMGRLRRNLQGITRFARQLGVVGALAAAISFAGPLQESAAFEQNLRDIAVTANLANAEVDQFIAKQTGRYEELGLAAGQYSDKIAATAGDLKAAGLDDALIDQLLPSIARSATASSAAIGDIGKVAFALSDTLKVPASQMEDALGRLVIAGKEGRFELAEMARYFPQLTAQVAKLGVLGDDAVTTLAAGLQIAMKGASDPAQAANNFKNFLSKIAAPDTVKRFSKMGVDIVAVMQDAVSKGINPIEAVIAKTQDLTGVGAKEIAKFMEQAKASGITGAEAIEEVRAQLEKTGGAAKLGELFGDQQVLDFLIPMLANIEEYKRIRDAVAAGDRSIIDQDFKTQSEGAAYQLRIFKELTAQAQRDFGDGFAAWLPTVNGYLLEFRDYLQEVEKQFPGLKEKVLQIGTGGIMAAVGLGALGVVLPFVAAGAKALGAVFAIASGPVGWLIGLLAGAVYLIYRHWDQLGPYFTAIWDGLKAGAAAAFGDLVSVALSAWEAVKGFWDGDLELFGFTIDEVKTRAIEQAVDAMDSLRSALAYLQEVAGGFSAGAVSAIPEFLKDLSSAGDTFKSAFSDISDAVSTLGELLAAIGNRANINSATAEEMAAFFRILGAGALEIAGASLEVVAKFVSQLAKGIKELMNLLAGKPIDWEGLKVADIETFQAMERLLGSILQLVGDLLATDLIIDWSGLTGNLKEVANEIIGWINKIREIENSMRRVLGAEQLTMIQPYKIENDDRSAKKMRQKAAANNPYGSLSALMPDAPKAKSGSNDNTQTLEFAPLEHNVKSDVAVGGQVNVQVTGPARVTSSTSTNPNVPIAPQTGRAVGRQ